MEFTKLGETIRTLRKKQKLTQEQLANKIGVTWEMISRYERGLSSPLPRLEILGKALKINPAEIYAMSYNIKLADGIKANKIKIINKITIQKLKGITTVDEFLEKFKEGYSYAAPKWIIQLDKESFLINTDNIQNVPKPFIETKELYISPNSKQKNNDYVLQVNKGRLELNKTKEKDSLILGILIASQSRYR